MSFCFRKSVLCIAILALMTTTAFGVEYDSIFEAAEKGTAEDVKQMIVAGADVNARTFAENTLVMSVVQNAEPMDILRVLIEAGADVNAANMVGMTPLMAVSAFGTSVEAVDALIAAGADIDAKDISEMTALMHAAGNDDRAVALKMVETLLKAGADVTLTDNVNHNALWYAEDYAKMVPDKGNQAIIDVLKRAMNGKK